MNNFKEIILVGGGGFATEIAEYISADVRKYGGPKIIGIVDDFSISSDVKNYPFIGGIASVVPHPALGFVVTSGTPRFRKEMMDLVNKQGGKLATFIHSSAVVASDAEIGEGVVICPFAIVNSGASLGCGAVLNVHTSVGHGARVGNYSVLSPYAALNGWAKIGDRCFLGTRATVFPKIQMGDSCVVDTHSYVKVDVGDQMIVSVRGQYIAVNNKMEK